MLRNLNELHDYTMDAADGATTTAAVVIGLMPKSGNHAERASVRQGI